MNNSAKDINPYNRLKDLWLPVEKKPIADWMQENIIIPPSVASIGGRINIDDITPYLRGIMDCLLDEECEEVIFQSSSQVGKTVLLLSVIFYYSVVDPSPIMFVGSTQELMKELSKERLDPFIRANPVLMNAYNEQRLKRSGNTILNKTFKGGFLSLVGANSATSLASKAIRILLLDEVDKYKDALHGEGSTIDQAKQRTVSYMSTSKIIMCSTPTEKGTSRIVTEYERGDMRQFYVRCPYCAHPQVLVWENLKYKDLPDAVYSCEKCQGHIPHSMKSKLMRDGFWKSENPNRRVASFFLSGLYSPFVSWNKLRDEWVEANERRDLEKIKSFKQLKLGIPFEESREKRSHTYLYSRREEGLELIPEQVSFLTCGVDVQKDYLSWSIYGWSMDDECWAIDTGEIHGDIPSGMAFEELVSVLSTPFPAMHEKTMHVLATCIDTGGMHTDSTYKFVKSYPRLFPVKGSSERNKPIIATKNQLKPSGVNLYGVGTDTAKDAIFNMLSIKTPGSNFIHFPKSPQFTEGFFRSLTSEERTLKDGKSVYVKTYDRNEKLDELVYALAAREIVKSSSVLRNSRHTTTGLSQSGSGVKKNRFLNNGFNLGDL